MTVMVRWFRITEGRGGVKAKNESGQVCMTCIIRTRAGGWRDGRKNRKGGRRKKTLGDNCLSHCLFRMLSQ